MKVEIRAAGLALPSTAKRAISRHAYFELSRFADMLSRITIQLSPDVTPPVDLDKACRVSVDWPLLGRIEAETRHSDPVQAACDGISRVRQRLFCRLKIANQRR